MRLTAINPTLFFIRVADGLHQGVDVSVAHDGAPAPAAILVAWGAQEIRCDLGELPSGSHTRRIYIPDLREPASLDFVLLADGEARDRRTVHWQPQRHWEVYVVHNSHHDLGYTDLPSNVLREHDRFLDDVIDFCAQTADWPDDSRFRYTIEQGWSVLHYLEHRPPAATRRLTQLLRAGRVEVTALFGNETSELCGHEEQIRLLYPSFRIKRRFGAPIRTAELNDVPGLSWGLVSVLAGAGIRYFAPRIPDYFSWGFKVHPFWDEAAVLPRDLPGAFWWEGIDGSRVLFWYGHRIELWTMEQALQEVPRRLQELAQRGYPYEVVEYRFQGGGRDNAPPDIRLSLIAREWNSRWAYPRLIVATTTQFCERFERVAGGGLRVLRGDLPNTDYTVGAASTARETAVNRLTHDALVAAEKFAAAATLVSDYAYPAEALAEAYDSVMLFDEHTWGMAHPIGPAQDGNWSQKAEFAYRAAALAHDILSKSTNRLADHIALPDAGYYLTVFNPLAQARSDLVEAPGVAPSPIGRPMYWRLPAPGEARLPVWVSGTALGRDLVNLPASLLDEPFELIDLATGQSVPYQVLALDDPLAARPWASYFYALGHVSPTSLSVLNYDQAHCRVLVFVAEDVPPLGYNTYRIVPTATRPSFASSVQVGDSWIENRFYRVALDPQSGAVVSIFDKALGREWVDGQAPYGCNQLVVRSPRSGETVAAARATVSIGATGPVFASLIVHGEDAPPGVAQRRQEIILYDRLPRIDFANRLLKDATPLLEIYFAFPFALVQPQFRYEASNSVIEPIRDQLPGSNSDAYAVQHWVDVWDAQGGVAWASREAPVALLGDLWPGYVSQAHHGVTPPGYGHPFLSDPAQLTRGHIYSYAMASNFRTNFQPVQVGDVLFRYSLTTHVGDWRQGRAGDFGRGVATPLIPVYLRGPQAGPLADAASFCQIDAPDVSLLTLKAAEDGDGLVVRLAERAGVERTVAVTLPMLRIDRAARANLVEEDQAVLDHDGHTVRVPLRAYGIATVRVRTGRRWPRPQRFAYY